MRPIVLCQLLFTSGYVYAWSGIGSLSWNGQTWLGVGSYGGISSIPESSDRTAVGVKLTLSGIPASLITSALGEVRQGNPVIIYQAFLTSGGAVVANPNNAWSGRMDVCEITEAGEIAVISITAESRLLDLNRSRERRYEKQDQLIDFPGDLGFDFVPSLQELSVVWGKATSTSIPHTSAGGGGGSYNDDRLYGRRGR